MNNEKFKIKEEGSVYEVTTSETGIKVIKDGVPFGEIDLTKANEENLSALKAGIGYGLALSKKQNFVQTNGQTNQTNQYPSPAYVNPNYFPETSHIDSSQGMNQGVQNTNTKVLNLSNGHSLLSNERNQKPYQGNQSGFISKLLITLLSGFGIGAIAAAIYIYTNLSNVIINLP